MAQNRDMASFRFLILAIAMFAIKLTSSESAVTDLNEKERRVLERVSDILAKTDDGLSLIQFQVLSFITLGGLIMGLVSQYHVHHHHHHHHHHHYHNHQATLASTPALSPDLREWTTECRFNLIIASSIFINYLGIFKYLKGPTTILTILLINGRCLHNDHCLFQPPLTGDVPHA